MGGMNPFDLPPAGAPVSADSPDPAHDPAHDLAPGRRRGRTALVAVLTLGLVGGGVAGVSQFASADRPQLSRSPGAEPFDDTVDPADDESTDDESTDDESTDDESGEESGQRSDERSDEREGPSGDDDDGATQEDSEATGDGRIVIDAGDGESVVIDLGDLDMGELTECIGLPLLDVDRRFGEFTPGDRRPGDVPLDLDELLRDLPLDGGAGLDGGSVTVVGPDGVSVVDLGENGSVTVATDDGELSVTTEGDASVSELDDLLGELGAIFERGPALFDEEQMGELPTIEPFDPDAIRSCIDRVLGE